MVTRRRSLFAKYAMPLISLVAGALIIGAVVEIYFSYEEHKHSLGRLQREKALSAAMRIEQFVQEVAHQLEWVAHTPWGARGVPMGQRRLDSLRLLRYAPAITEVAHLDPAGIEQLRVSRLAMDELGKRGQRTHETAFAQARERKAYFGPVYFRKESEPYMTMALAGNPEDGGVVVAETNLKFIWDVVAALKVGQAGYAYVVDGAGGLIAHPDISLVLQKTDFSRLPQVLPVLSAGRQAALDEMDAGFGRDIKGREVLAARATIDPLKWHVFVELPIEEAHAPIVHSAMRTLGLLVIGLGVATIAAVLLARRMVAPVQTLQAGAARVAAGSLEHRIEVRTGDEIEDLAAEFNHMTEQLQESYTGLERKVDERTRALREALEQQTATSEILRTISSSPTDLQPILDIVVERAAKLCGASEAQLMLVDASGMREMATFGIIEHGTDETALPLSRETLNGRTILDRCVCQFPDQAAAFNPDENVDGSMVAVPLMREGVALGSICVRRRELTPFTKAHIDLLKTFADQAVIAIVNVRLFKELQTRTEELATSVKHLQALAEVSQAVNSTLDVDQVLKTIVARAVMLSHSQSGAIYEYDDASAQLLLQTTHGITPEAQAQMLSHTVALGEGITGRAAAARRPIQVADIRALEVYEGKLKLAVDAAQVRALLSVPMLQGTRLIGTLTVSRQDPGEYPPHLVDLLQTFAVQSTLAIRNARLFREIEIKSRELEVASKHKSQFLANMSHELRTPLNAILGYTELIVDRIYGEVPQEVLQVLMRVQASGRHLLGLINDVLDLSKIEAGQLTLSVSEFSMEDVLHSVMQAVEPLAAEKGLAVTVQVDPAVPIASGDERRIAQVLMNLMGNAIKFTDAGTVRVQVSAVDQELRVAVQDTGPGIPQDHCERIFEEFQQVDGSATRKKGGTGLGLAISKRIVALHGGRIWVESQVGQGSTFHFSLPVRRALKEAVS